MDFKKHPDYPTKSLEEIEDAVFHASIDNGALAMKGTWFYADDEEEHDTLFFRTTYAAAPFDKINEAIRRLGEAVRKEFKLTA